MWKPKTPKPTYRPDRGVAIAKLLWPDFIAEPQGGFWDQYGIDGWLNGDSCQVKFDGTIARSGNVWHEIYEKTAWRSEQSWRKAGGKVDYYIFITETQADHVGYRVTLHCLAENELGACLQVIRPNNGERTSMGFLLPLSKLVFERRVGRRVDAG